MEQLKEKQKRLEEYLSGFGSIAIAYSSGVDSTYLLHTAAKVLGSRVLAVTCASCLIPGREIEDAKEFCKNAGIDHLIIEPDVLSVEGFAANPPERCYICKRAIFTMIIEEAGKRGISHVAEGSNTDDDGDFRPGHKAVAELGVLSPLRAAGMSKADIRALSNEAGLKTWDKPSFACLASRFAYGEEITEEKLGMVGRAEQLLIDMGFSQMRVRMHGNIARIEVLPDDLPKVTEEGMRGRIYTELKDMGFSYVTLDLKGYRTGSMNETLKI
ncbi:MAG: ATP-dependent sacrificial sulfur transferase LarE [Lachnospiraceae bacterium]|nr:ATP-dependent sacrificial sulfur transferase LarE [Lachnospiraceae bacterium]